MPENKDKGAKKLSDESQYCEECGGVLKPNKIKLEEFEDGKLYVIEDVPVMECEGCGEVWVPEPIIEEFENMISTSKKRHSLKKLNRKIKEDK
jgi:YgiT-type zinc finger domain-containing protein